MSYENIKNSGKHAISRYKFILKKPDTGAASFSNFVIVDNNCHGKER